MPYFPSNTSGGASTDADYWVETANGSLSAEIVVGATGITTAAYASRQAAAKAGRLFLPNNGFYVERDTGSAWAPWGPIFPMTAPVDGDFAWINQGGASVDTTNGGILLTCPTDGSSHNLRIRKKSAPATPYTITGWFITNTQLSGGQYGFGLGFRQSSDGKCHVIYVYNSTGVINFGSTKFDSATGFNSHYSTVAFTLSFPICLRISDDGTDRKTYFSYDGVTFTEMSTIGRTNYLTADEVMFYGNTVGTTRATTIRLLSWKQA